METILIVLFFVWVFGFLHDDSCDCCHDADRLKEQVDELDDDLTTVEENLADIDRRLIAIEEHYGLQAADSRE